jgi:hypothetical protein
MTANLRQLAILCALAPLAGLLAGCGTINEKVSAGIGDYVPQWAGGLPADAPPRPGTAKYDAYMAERERLRQMPAADRPQQPATSGTPASTAPRDALDPVH